MMPQWEFLDFLRDEAQRHPSFRLLLQAKAEAPLEEDGRVVGVRASTADGPLEIHADLVIGADGRGSTLRGHSGLQVLDLGAPIDVLWMRVGKREGDPTGSGGRVGTGRFMAMIDRGDYWQCAYVIRKGGIEAIRARGLDAFRSDLASLAPVFASRLAQELPDWDAVKLLSVRVDRLAQWWKPGLLFIGDAAHAMSPIGGVGINLAVQDAVAAAKILGPVLANNATNDLTPWLARVQARRLWPTRVTQAVQVAAQTRLIDPLLDSTQAPRMPFVLKLLNRFPALRVLPAYAVGVGARPEHVTKG
jgi:2-polyprenyl-6-methoxyphenol hydroxylase-like FAD-dependent oxidoreductase